MTQPVTLTAQNGIAVITIDNPPVNALSPGVPEGILTALETAERDPSVRAIVVIGGGGRLSPGPISRNWKKPPGILLRAGRICIRC